MNPNPDVAEFLVELGPIRKICCGWSHGLMLNQSGEAFTWGNYFKDYKKVCNIEDTITPKKIEIEYAVGDSENNDADKFQEIPIEGKNRSIIDISSGFNHLAIVVLGKEQKIKELYTWGANEFVRVLYLLNS